MKPQHGCVFLAVWLSAAPAMVRAQSNVPRLPRAPLAVEAVSAGEYVGSWKGEGDAAGKLRLKLKRDNGGWAAEAWFTYQDAEVPTKMKSVRIDGTKIELVFEWQIEGTTGQSSMAGEFAGPTLRGTYESKTPDNTTRGSWSASRT